MKSDGALALCERALYISPNEERAQDEPEDSATEPAEDAAAKTEEDDKDKDG